MKRDIKQGLQGNVPVCSVTMKNIEKNKLSCIETME
jgi:hypothetical protein